MSLYRRLLSSIDISDRKLKTAVRTWVYLVYIFVYAPIVVVIVLSFTPRDIPFLPMPGFSLKWYTILIPIGEYDSQLVEGFIQSVKVGVLAALGAGIVGTLAGLGLVRNETTSRFLSTETLNTLFLLPIIVPWIVTGISILVLYNLIGVQGSFASLVVGHILIGLPFVVTLVSTQLYGFDRSLEEAAQNLGASRLRTFYEVTLPLIAPSVLAGMMFAFTISFDNFTQTFFWAGTDTQTLPIVIFGKITHGIDPSINSIGTVMIIFSVSIALIGERLAQRFI
jgi:spermidine/putrescine transport system permease protein